jgi:hypothetical protein
VLRWPRCKYFTPSCDTPWKDKVQVREKRQTALAYDANTIKGSFQFQQCGWSFPPPSLPPKKKCCLHQLICSDSSKISFDAVWTNASRKRAAHENASLIREAKRRGRRSVSAPDMYSSIFFDKLFSTYFGEARGHRRHKAMKA